MSHWRFSLFKVLQIAQQEESCLFETIILFGFLKQILLSRCIPVFHTRQSFEMYLI